MIMPARNTIRQFAAGNYYHVYNRGVDKKVIFKDDQDYAYFLSLLKKYLTPKQSRRGDHRLYPSYADEVELVAFCLMPNHFHLFLYQSSDRGVERLLKSVSVSYSMYFNKRHSRMGTLFQQRYRAAHISSIEHFLYLSYYIHLNPADYRRWNWSSLAYYIGDKQAEWVKPHHVLDSGGEYLASLAAHSDDREELKSRLLLADT